MARILIIPFLTCIKVKGRRTQIRFNESYLMISLIVVSQIGKPPNSNSAAIKGPGLRRTNNPNSEAWFINLTRSACPSKMYFPSCGSCMFQGMYLEMWMLERLKICPHLQSSRIIINSTYFEGFWIIICCISCKINYYYYHSWPYSRLYSVEASSFQFKQSVIPILGDYPKIVHRASNILKALPILSKAVGFFVQKEGSLMCRA